MTVVVKMHNFKRKDSTKLHSLTDIFIAADLTSEVFSFIQNIEAFNQIVNKIVDPLSLQIDQQLVPQND